MNKKIPFVLSATCVFFLTPISCSHLGDGKCETENARLQGYRDADRGELPKDATETADGCRSAAASNTYRTFYLLGYQRRAQEICRPSTAEALGREAAAQLRTDPLSNEPFKVCTENRVELDTVFTSAYRKELCRPEMVFRAGAEHGKGLRPNSGEALLSACTSNEMTLTKAYAGGYREGLSFACSVAELYVKGLEHGRDGTQKSGYLDRLKYCPEPTRSEAVSAYLSGYEQAKTTSDPGRG